MGMFIQGFLYKEFAQQIADANLDKDDLVILRAVILYELYTSEDFKETVLRPRVRDVIDRLRKPKPPPPLDP